MECDSLYCCKWRKISKSRHDLDLGPTVPNIELVIFIDYKVFKFHVPRSIVIMEKHTHTETQTHTQRDSSYKSISLLQVELCKVQSLPYPKL